MHLMVYAPYGRTGVYMLQDFCRRLGIRATDHGNPGPRCCSQGVATRTSARTSAARGPGFLARVGARRCAPAPAGPRLFGAPSVRLHRKGGPDVRTVAQTSPLQRSLWGRSKDSAGHPASKSSLCRSNMLRSNFFEARWSATASSSTETTILGGRKRSVSLATRGGAMCPFDGRPLPSAARPLIPSVALFEPISILQSNQSL